LTSSIQHMPLFVFNKLDSTLPLFMFD